ncbi:MAG: S1 RNA-binding domain-containing protein [Candidatus Woesearchaeota archaeon]|nr:S1 RNA-binding domain-containing protein [Candidatus Woesearchaeota archaeon]
MFFKKTGFPEEDELVLCTVTDIQYHSVFCGLDEYGRMGMIHISEVAPGRIRNIYDFVKKDKKVVCKVLRIDSEKGHIDLSLRRVTETQKKNKLDQVKKEQLAEKIIEQAAKELSIDVTKLYDSIAGIILKKYSRIYACFYDIVEGKTSLELLGIEKKTAKSLEELVKSRIKKQQVAINGELMLKSYQPNGIEIVKDALKNAKISDKLTIRYKGGGKYVVDVNADDYKEAENLLNTAMDNATSFIKKKNGEGAFVRIK